MAAHYKDLALQALALTAEIPDDVDLPRGAVPYLPTGLDEIEILVREAPLGPDDVLVDIGAGLGRVCLIAHALSGARTHGIELQAHLIEAARSHARALGVADRVTFEHGDASTARLDASVVFLYAPCNGPMLAAVIERIRELAARRSIVVATVAVELDEPWLRPRATVGMVHLYDGSSSTMPA